LARYTHRVAVSNHRLVNVADGQVTFRWKNERLGVGLLELGRAALSDLLTTPDAAFQAATERVLRKIDALYRRLA
jgi:hypothetical protein